jgi:hypothetical protein
MYLKESKTRIVDNRFTTHHMNLKTHVQINRCTSFALASLLGGARRPGAATVARA